MSWRPGVPWRPGVSSSLLDTLETDADLERHALVVDLTNDTAHVADRRAQKEASHDVPLGAEVAAEGMDEIEQGEVKALPLERAESEARLRKGSDPAGILHANQHVLTELQVA